MAEGNWNNPMAKEIVTISKNDQYNIISTEYHHKVYVSGSIKILRLGFDVNSYTGVNQWKQIYSIPTSCLPTEDISTMGITKNGVSVQIQITTSGIVNFNSPSNLVGSDLVIIIVPYI